MRRTTCSGCGAGDLEPFLDLGQSPIADAYTSAPDVESETYPLEVAVCPKCRLVQLLEVVDDLFGTGYSFYTSASAPLSAYHAAYADGVLNRWHAQAGRGVVEVGCNDGDLLRHFAAFPALGVDPAVGPTTAARSRGLEVETRPFGLQTALDIRDRRGRQGLIVANHVLAHVADVADMIGGIAALLDRDDGVAMVEVQYLPDLLVNNGFDLVYHEHRNFFSLTSLEQAAGRWGLHVIDAELTERQGGSLRVTLTHQPRSSARVDRIRGAERWLNDHAAYAGMQGRVERIRDRLRDLIVGQTGTVAGYGAPAKATTLLNFCGLTVNRVEWVVDTTVAKQGRYIPGTRIPILDPDTAPRPGAYLLLAHNYARPIMRREAFPGPWIVPIPAPVIL